jgi:hypothetical protein
MSSKHSAIEAGTLGECWLAVSALILESGEDELYDLQPIKEIARLTLAATSTDPHDPITDRLAVDPNCKSASITTFMPLTDTAYIPCFTSTNPSTPTCPASSTPAPSTPAPSTPVRPT